MTKRTRSILFIVIAICFFIAAPLTIFYSLGWRIDWKAKRLIKVGLFYFQVLPRNVEIYLNGKLEKKTNFFFNAASIENLLPERYDIEIKKEGFHSWKKSLEIKEKQVTEAKNILLVPQNPNFKTLATGIKDFYFSPDGKKIVFKEEVASESENQNIAASQRTGESWSLQLFELKNNVKSRLIGEKDISRGEGKNELVNLKFSPDSKRLLLEIAVGEQLKYYVLETEENPPVLVNLDFLNTSLNFNEIYFNPRNPDKLIFLDEDKLKEADLVKKEATLSAIKEAITFSVINNDVYYLNNSGFVLKTDLSFSSPEKLNTLPFSVKNETEYKIGGSNSHIILKEENALYIFDKNKKVFEKLSDSVKNFAFSPDSKKLAYSNDYETWVLFLDRNQEQPQREKGDKVFLTRFSEKIDDVFWWTNYYLILNEKDKIKIVEIDDRDKTNIAELASFPSLSKIFWNKDEKKVYVLDKNILYVSDRLIPLY